MDYIKNSIDTYLAEDNPGYAIQLVGEWGSGKTFFVKQHLKDSMYYISAFGLSDINEVYAALFYQMHKRKEVTKNFIKRLREIKISLFGAIIPLGEGVSSLFTTIMKSELKNNKVIVIDDIERSLIPQEIIFGLVSNCLENYDCHVILLMNDINNISGLIEKTVGRRLKVTPDFLNVYDFFSCKHINENHLIDIKSNITNVFIKMNCNSLRILKRILFEIDTIIKCIDNELIRYHKEIIHEKLIVFSVLSILVKQGRVDADKLEHRMEYMSYLFSELNDEKNRADKCNPNSKYIKEFIDLYRQFDDELDITSDFLNNDVIYQILEHGVFCEKNISDSVSDYINKRNGNIEPWKIIYQYTKFDNEHIDKAIEQLDLIIKNRSFIDVGHVIHNISAIFYIREYYCDKLGIINLNTYIRNYTDFLYNETDAFLNDYSNHWFHHDFDSSHGFSYLSKYDSDFNVEIDFIKDKTEKYTANFIIDAGREFNELLINDFDMAKDFIWNEIPCKKIYIENPIFKYCDGNTFSKNIIHLEYKKRNLILDLFRYRYRNGQINFKLNGEVVWLGEVIEFLMLNNENNIGLDKVRVNGIIKSFENLLRK